MSGSDSKSEIPGDNKRDPSDDFQMRLSALSLKDSVDLPNSNASSNTAHARDFFSSSRDMHSSGCFCNAFGSEHVVGNLVIGDASWPIQCWNIYDIWYDICYDICYNKSYIFDMIHDMI